MDIEKLIEQLRSYTYWLGQDGPESHDIHPLICDEAATTLSTLQGENEKLRDELEQERDHRLHAEEHADLFLEDCKRLNVELEKVKRERDAAMDYLKGQCRYCKHNLVCTSREGPHSNCWNWRGPKKED